MGSFRERQFEIFAIATECRNLQRGLEILLHQELKEVASFFRKFSGTTRNNSFTGIKVKEEIMKIIKVQLFIPAIFLRFRKITTSWKAYEGTSCKLGRTRFESREIIIKQETKKWLKSAFKKKFSYSPLKIVSLGILSCANSSL